MSIYLAIALIIALIWSAIDRRGGAGDRIIRFALISFGAFALISAVFWIANPGGTARLVVTAGSDWLTQRIVQGRGAIVFVFGLLAIAAARGWPDRPYVAMVGPFAYNALMSIEAIRAQFTAIATPERWVYVTGHGLWAIALGFYVARLPALFRRPVGWGAVPPFVLALAGIATGALLYLAPGQLVAGDGAHAPLLFHSAHAFGASLIAGGLMAGSIAMAGAEQRPWMAAAVALACALLTVIAFASGFQAMAMIQGVASLAFLLLLYAYRASARQAVGAMI